MNFSSLKKIPDPFHDFAPVCWCPSADAIDPLHESICSVKRNHGVKGTIRLHNQRDEINENKLLADRVIVEYKIGSNSYPLFTVSDFLNATYAFNTAATGNIMGDIAERIARRITKYFLKHLSPQGKTGGIFNNRFNPKNRNNFIIAHTDNLILKIEKYPNLVLLKHTGKGKFGYENIKELDGLFDYRYGNIRHFLVLESKLDKINVDCNDLIDQLFTPLSELFPGTRMSYILFSNPSSIFGSRDGQKLRELRETPRLISDTLLSHGIGSLFFTFNETYSDFERITSHIITQYRAMAHLDIELHGRIKLSSKELTLFDEGETPHLKLVKDFKTGLWREMPLTHKNVKFQK